MSKRDSAGLTFALLLWFAATHLPFLTPSFLPLGLAVEQPTEKVLHLMLVVSYSHQLLKAGRHSASRRLHFNSCRCLTLPVMASGRIQGLAEVQHLYLGGIQGGF